MEGWLKWLRTLPPLPDVPIPFPASHSASRPSITVVLWDPVPSSVMHACRQNTHIHKTNTDINMKEIYSQDFLLIYTVFTFQSYVPSDKDQWMTSQKFDQ